MNSTIKMSIPMPCRENWAAMSPVEKGRFCGACQKNVFDFTKATDREIYTAYKQNNSLCGRFNNTQLNRELTFRDNNKTGWLTTFFASIGLMAISTGAFAQKTGYNKPKVTALAHKKTPKAKPFNIGGTVTDTACAPLPNVYIGIKGKDVSTVTDSTGYFSLPVRKGDIVVCDVVGYKTLLQTVAGKDNLAFALEEDMGVAVAGYSYSRREYITAGSISVVTVTKRRSFFGRLIVKIGKAFKKHE